MSVSEAGGIVYFFFVKLVKSGSNNKYECIWFNEEVLNVQLLKFVSLKWLQKKKTSSSRKHSNIYPVFCIQRRKSVIGV